MRTVQEIKYNISIPGWMSFVELHQLDFLVSALPANSIVIEIGSLHGRSGYCMAKANPNITLYCIDYWLGQESVTRIGSQKNTLEVFQHFTKDCNNIITRKIDRKNNVDWDDTLVDMVFVDASHRNPDDWDIISYWLPKIKPGGILSGHDYCSKFPDVVDNVKRLCDLGLESLPLSDLPSISSIWAFRI